MHCSHVVSPAMKRSEHVPSYFEVHTQQCERSSSVNRSLTANKKKMRVQLIINGPCATKAACGGKNRHERRIALETDTQTHQNFSVYYRRTRQRKKLPWAHQPKLFDKQQLQRPHISYYLTLAFDCPRASFAIDASRPIAKSGLPLSRDSRRSLLRPHTCLAKLGRRW